MNQNHLKIGKIKDFFLDLVFPKSCVGCGRDGVYLCKECLDTIIWVKTQVCPECGKISLQGKYCLNCRKEKTLKGVVICAHFENGPIREAIHNYKYNKILEFGQFFSQNMAETLRSNLPYKKDWLITYVPLHWQRAAERGFNQSEILAKGVAARLDLECANLLSKGRFTRRQVQLKSKVRKKNLENVFTLKSPLDLSGKIIILIDDISTTGTTLNECAQVLKKAGAKAVWGLVIARG